MTSFSCFCLTTTHPSSGLIFHICELIGKFHGLVLAFLGLVAGYQSKENLFSILANGAQASFCEVGRTCKSNFVPSRLATKLSLLTCTSSLQGSEEYDAGCALVAISHALCSLGNYVAMNLRSSTLQFLLLSR